MKQKLLWIALACVSGALFSEHALAQGAKPTDQKVVATLQGTPITQEELRKYAASDLDSLEHERIQFDLNFQRKKHQVLEDNLSRLIEERLLKTVAGESGISVDQLLAKALEGKFKEPTDDDVKAYYEDNKQRISQPLIQINRQIYQYLRTRNYNQAKAAFIEQLKQERGVTIALDPLRATVGTEGSPVAGPADAPVTIVEFSDFQCPYCAKMYRTLHQVSQKYGAQVRLAYRNFPLVQLHPYAQKAAEAALCAADQGRFWEMHDLMFQTQGQLKEDDLRVKAAQLKLDMDKFSSCLNSGAHASKVKQDLDAGAELGVSGTPAIFINGRFVQGAVPFETLARIIDEEIRSARQTK